MKQSPAGSVRSGSATPNPQSSTPHGLPQQGQQQQPHSGFGNLLRHMFETPRHASFAVSVTLHELSNVPQLTGNFSVKWKFRGHRPHDADKMLENPQKRIKPNDVRLPPSVKGLRGSASFQSLRTNSSTSLAGSTLTAGGGSTPHPLGQRSASGIVPTVHRPTPLHTSHAATFPYPHPHPVVATAPNSRPSSFQAATPRSSDNVVDLAPESDDNASGPPSAPSSRAQSTYSVNSSLSVPGPSSRSRTGTGSSIPPPSALNLDPNWTSRPASRSASLRSETSVPEPLTPSTAASSQSHTRSILEGWPSPDATSRKGTTPMCEVRAHRVGWEYQVQHTVRVMIGKPANAGSGTATPMNGGKVPSSNRPRLGEGPMSDSGLNLEIHQDNGKGKDNILFGYVNIDLAPFADLGRTARKFLLKDSKTNATIRITVDMKFIGGEQDWVAPPLAEGHLVTGVTELTGDEGFPDLQLLPTRSYSSDSTHSSVSRPSARSGNSAVSLTQQFSHVNVDAATTKHRYKTFEHHLRPEHSAKHRQNTQSGPPGRQWTVDSAASSADFAMSRVMGSQFLTESPSSSPLLIPTSLSPVSTKHPGGGYFDRGSTYDRSSTGPSQGQSQSSKTRLSPLQTSSILSQGPATVLSPTSMEADQRPLSPVDIASPERSPTRNTQPSRRARHGRRASEDLQADLVIEGIFNPIAGEELSPFTYIPGVEEEPLPIEEESSDMSLSTLQLEVQPVPNPRRWDRIRRRVASAHRPREAAMA